MIPNYVELGRTLVGGILAQVAAPLPPHQDTVLDMVVGAGPVVRAVLAILVAFSVGCWGIALAKSVEMRRARRQSERFTEIFWDAKNLAAIQTASVDLKESPVAQVFRGGYQELQRLTKAKRGNPGGDEDAAEFGGIENVQRAMVRARTQEVTRLERGLTFLATTASTAPFIGLFGTVGYHDRVPRPLGHHQLEHPGGGARHRGGAGRDRRRPRGCHPRGRDV